MTKQVIGIGTVANDGTGDPIRTAMDKSNKNFTQLWSQPFYHNAGSKIWLPVNHNNTGGNGTAPGANSIRLMLGYIADTITISTLCTRVSTLSAGGNFQLAIYAADSTGMPTGNALVSTSSTSTAATGMQTPTASKQLTPGWYWFALNCDNGTAAFVSVGSSSLTVTQVVGGFGTANVFASINGLAVTQTFGTWPDLTGTVWSTANEVAASLTVPLIGYQIASVP